MRSALVDIKNHKIFLNKKYSQDEVNIADPGGVKLKLKEFQGEMQMYSGIVGMVYSWVIYDKRWNKRIEKVTICTLMLCLQIKYYKIIIVENF